MKKLLVILTVLLAFQLTWFFLVMDRWTENDLRTTYYLAMHIDQSLEAHFQEIELETRMIEMMHEDYGRPGSLDSLMLANIKLREAFFYMSKTIDKTASEEMPFPDPEEPHLHQIKWSEEGLSVLKKEYSRFIEEYEDAGVINLYSSEDIDDLITYLSVYQPLPLQEIAISDFHLKLARNHQKILKELRTEVEWELKYPDWYK